jgi:hypothetical protein
MTDFKRFAVYYAPPPGDFATRANLWLSDAAPDLPGLPGPAAALTVAPRRYGFHGTIKAPFRLADGVDARMLQSDLAALATGLPPVRMAGLRLEILKGFIALIPEGDETDLLALGAEIVSRLDPLRAPLTEAEIARRRPDRLTARQRELLNRWGYPYVMEEFQFHLTLSDDLPEAVADAVAPVLADWLAPVLPRPFVIDNLCLMGEDAAGRFHLVSRHALTGG